jgi:hypothetical protein
LNIGNLIALVKNGAKIMKWYASLVVSICCLIMPCLAQTVIRGQFGSMTNAKIASIPDFVLPAIYSDRTAHPLPATVNHETDAACKLYFPPTGWCIDGWSCSNASAVSFGYDYAVQTYEKITTSGQYPAYTYNFTYHFLDNANQATGGDGWMYVEAFDILKACGCPTSTDFGGFGADGDNVIDNNVNVWMSGYDKYYTAMKIRADEYYKIDPGTSAGDILIKQILFDYADGTPTGSNLSVQGNDATFKTSTVNGRKTFSAFGGGGGHCLSIVGYDDNQSGGSWLMQSGWGDGDYWCPYTLLHSGGSWYNNPTNNKYVMFCRIKKNYTPKVTFKVSLTQDQRNKICIMTGVANSSNASSPTTTMDYAGAFNYDGGSVPMCGTNKSSTIEIGLDLTDLLSTVTVSEPTFFLKVLSKGGTGQVNSLALEDYTGTAVREVKYAQANVPISGTTTLAVTSPGTIISDQDWQRTVAKHQGNGLVASYAAGSQTVKFSFPGDNMRTAMLQITDLSGRIVLTKACPNAGTASWDLRDFFGRNVSNGAYLACVTVQGRDGTSRQLSTKVMVRN